MQLKIHGVQITSFNFFNINEIDDDEKKRILEKRDTVDISNRKNKESKVQEKNEVVITPHTSMVFTFDEQYYFVGELAAKISLFDTTLEEFENEDFQAEFVENIISVFTHKFDLFVGIFSQEVYSATRLPERTKMEIVKRQV